MKPWLHRLFPLTEVLASTKREDLGRDLVAGLTTAIMLIPQGMAYAMLAGLDPIIGLYASTLPVLVYALMGTSRQLAVGPVAMVSLFVAAGVGPLAGGDPVTYAGLAALLALMVGTLQLGMGMVRLGFLVKFLSHPVIAGFTSAAALVIGASQLKHLLGVSIPRSPHLHETLWAAWELAPEANPATFAVGAASLVALVLLKRLAPRVPRFLLVVVAGTLAVGMLGLTEAGVATVGEVPAGLPSPALPPLDLASIQSLLPVAVAIALVGFMESISVASNFARQHRYDIDADQELRALGAANLVGAFFQAYPVTGGFSRTAVNDQAGARSGLAGLVTAGAVGITLVLFTPWFHDLPKAVLAAIILSAVLGLVQVDEARHLWRTSRPDLALMGLTFLATLAVGIEEGIVVGVAASLLWFVWQTANPHVAVLGRLPGTEVYRKLERNPDAEPSPGVLAVRIDAPLFFANTAFLKTTVRDLVDGADAPVEAIILDATGIGSVDASGIAVLEEILHELEGRGIALWVAGMRGPVRDMLDRAHLTERVGPERFVLRVHDAMSALRSTPRPRLVAP